MLVELDYEKGDIPFIANKWVQKVNLKDSTSADVEKGDILNYNTDGFDPEDDPEDDHAVVVALEEGSDDDDIKAMISGVIAVELDDTNQDFDTGDMVEYSEGILDSDSANTGKASNAVVLHLDTEDDVAIIRLW